MKSCGMKCKTVRAGEGRKWTCASRRPARCKVRWKEKRVGGEDPGRAAEGEGGCSLQAPEGSHPLHLRQLAPENEINFVAAPTLEVVPP